MLKCQTEIVWRNVILMTVYHLFGLHALYYLFTLQVLVYTFLWGFFVAELANVGVICGAHRLWSHRSYKAKVPLKIFLMICNSIAYQNSIYVWARDHRVHHKFTDTDADPHNINRGFFFAHMGWLLCRKHPDVITKGKTVDLSDLESDKIVMFQHKHHKLLGLIFSVIIPTVVPWYFWNENLYVSFCGPTVLRYLITLHGTWMVNSVAHLWGSKPYDKNIKPVENRLVSFITAGEGWHNYHHTFPWDYKASELFRHSGNTQFIDLMAKIGLAYDLKVASNNIIEKLKLKNKDCKTYEKTRQPLFTEVVKFAEMENRLLFDKASI